MKLALPRTSFLLFALTAFAAQAQVVINEINYDPADTTKAIEFVELHNPSGLAVNVGGWRLEDGVDYTIPVGTTIAAGGYLVLAESPTAFQTRYGFAPLGPWVGSLSNKGERLQLRNSAAAVVDEVNYGVGFPWPTSPNGGGTSMESIHPALDRSLGGSWRASATTADTVLIPKGSTGWRYRETRSDPPSTWKQASFDDSGAEWAAATLPAGFATGTQFTPAVTFGTSPSFGGNASDKTRTYYFRKHFTIANPAQVPFLTINIRRDDGAVVWVNDDATATAVSADGTFAAPYTYASLAPNATNVATYVSHTIPGSKLVAGDNVLAIELHQSSISSSDLLLDVELVMPGQSGGSPGAVNTDFSATAPPAIRQVDHTPAQPTSGVPVVITAKVTDPQGVAGVTLSYQAVNPGSYIRRTDAAYASTWTNVAMLDNGTGGDAIAGDGVFSYTMPAVEQTNRRLMRYRISATDGASSITVPYADDDQPNFAYFVYDGVPAWSGAIQPGGTPVRATVNTFSPTLLNSLQTWQLITDANDHDNMLYNSGFNNVRFYGTFVYEGKVYDHIQYHNRGIGSTYVTGKNKFAFYFNRARNVRVRNNWGNYFDEDWNSVPVDACASPWASVHRGMSGVEEAVAYRLYELAGMASLRTTYLHMRVVRGANEAGTGQYDTDFWGLYMALEPTEKNFLNERSLPDGNLYAIEGSAGDKKAQGSTQPTDTSDWTTYRDAAVLAGQTETWYRANMDLPAFYSFFALNRFCGNVDVRPGDNYRYYHRSSDNRWVIIPYDLDMMSLPAHHWGGTLADGLVWAGAPSQSVVLARHTAIAIEYRNRCREFLSLLASDASPSGGQIGQLVDEYAQIVNPTGLALTWADADAALWSNHPRTTGTGANSGQTSHKNNWFRTPFTDTRGGLAGTPTTNWTRTLPDPDGDGYATFEDQMNYLTGFMTNTWTGGTWLRSNGIPAGYGYQHLLWESLYGGWGNVNANPTAADLAFPSAPTITYSGPVGFPANALDFTSSTFVPASGANGGTTFGAIQWRIGEISAPGITGYVAGTKRKYEIENVWTSAELPTFSANQRVPLVSVEPGKTYRARVRHKDANGRWSQWSAPVQFVAGTPDVSTYSAALVITEINYNPAPVTPTEFAAGYSSDDFEWLEVKNISAQPVDMTGVRFTKGIDFDFPAVWTIPANGYALVVRNLAAFQARWGTGLNAIIAGSTASNLSNGGDEVKLSYGVGTEIHRVVYDDVAPWPVTPDGTGRTLVRKTATPLTLPDQTNGTLWRASYALGGSPGADDVLTFDLWNDDFPGVSSLTADDDGDGLVNLMEYALASSPLGANAGPASSSGNYTVLGVPGTYLVLTFTHRTNGSDLTIEAQFTTSLTGTWSANGVLENSVTNPDGTVTETWRSPVSLAEQPSQFARVRVLKP
jgi:hypothetical protein